MTLNDLGEEGRLPKLVGVLALTVVYWFPVRRWFSRWGTMPEELVRVMPGDAVIPNRTEMSMQAITVNAPPEDIWPWLVQMGYQRGGLYSYDWLDRLFGFLDRPSATRILPEFQQLAVGDTIPWGRAGTELTVAVLEPCRALAFSYEDRGFKWVWQSVSARRSAHAIRHARQRAGAAHPAVVARHAHHGAGGLHHDPPLSPRRQGAGRGVAGTERPLRRTRREPAAAPSCSCSASVTGSGS
jgi:hypothetical protein